MEKEKNLSSWEYEKEEEEESEEEQDDNQSEEDQDYNHSSDDGEDEDADEKTLSDDATVEVNGEEITLGELKKGYMRQSDYTKKTQELSKKEKGDVQRKSEEIVDNPDEYPEADVKAAKYLLGILKKEGEIVTRDDLEKERQIDKIESDMKAAAKKFGRIKELPKFDEGEIIQHMQETGIRNPEKAYKDLYEDEWFDYKVKQAKKSKSYMTEKRGEKIQKNKKEYKEGEEGDREYLLDEIRKIKT